MSSTTKSSSTQEIEEFKNSFNSLTKEFQEANKNQQVAYEVFFFFLNSTTKLKKNFFS